MSENLNPASEQPTQPNPERNESMKAEITETKTESLESEEISETVESHVAGTETTVDVDAVQEDEDGSEDEQEEVLPDACRYKDFSATVSPKVSVSQKKITHNVTMFMTGVLLVVLIAFSIGDFFYKQNSSWDTGCLNGMDISAHVPNDFPGGAEAYAKSGGKYVETGICDNVAHEGSPQQ